MYRKSQAVISVKDFLLIFCLQHPYFDCFLRPCILMKLLQIPHFPCSWLKIYFLQICQGWQYIVYANKQVILPPRWELGPKGLPLMPWTHLNFWSSCLQIQPKNKMTLIKNSFKQNFRISRTYFSQMQRKPTNFSSPKRKIKIM